MVKYFHPKEKIQVPNRNLSDSPKNPKYKKMESKNLTIKIIPFPIHQSQ